MTLAMAQMLLEKRKNIETQAHALLDAAEAEKRDLSAEEGVQFEKMSADMDGLRKRHDQMVQFETDNKSAEDALRKSMGDKPEVRDGSDVEGQLRQLLGGEIRSMDLQGTKDELRVLSGATPAAGGATVPTTFYGQLIEHLIESATMLSAGATVLTTSSGEPIVLPVTTSHGAAAATAAGAAIGGTDPTFAQRTLNSYKFAQLVQVPKELVDDTGVDLEGYLARACGRNVGNALGAKLITGTGTNEPTGIFTSSTLGKTGATGAVGVPTFDELIDLFYSVTGPYRSSKSAGWLIKDTTAGQIRKLKDTSGRYLWEAAVVAGQPDLILSKPVYTDPYVPATGLGAKSVAFGDLSAYFVRMINGVRFERSDDFAFGSDVVTFRAIVRGDGVLADQTGAVKHYVGGAS
ncbi:hypothetical protein MB46_10370 [Arthrobacter alpinus]|uniref:phage major capsid protein n=1 Tax=Arthrobacter alpinus TaxID=656366 RepID=UPI000678C24C|nr:phage major capsid protein [Arthrobacter alpinus]ALV45825.1 hypothetical protein MB46_10370 [Arthrobacter alpinus]